MNDKFMGMANYIMESIHDLLVSDSKSISDFISSQGATTPRANVSWRTSSTTLTTRRPSKGTSQEPTTTPLTGGTRLPHTLLMGAGLQRTQRSRLAYGPAEGAATRA
jgi:hypothetical protein